MSDGTTAQSEHHVFEADVSRLLHLMVHAVYSNKDIFLRELVSNAADACEKLRYLSQSEPGLLGDEPGFAISIEADPEGKRLVVTDSGIGMSREELKENLGTIARSGTRLFLEKLEQKDAGNALIGQFGVGFYAAFMVASKVRVVSVKAGSGVANSWESDGLGAFTVDSVPLADAPKRGTRVELFLNDDSVDYADPATVERIVKSYSAHVPVPISLVKPGDDAPKSLTDGSALWTKSKSDVSAEDYKEFYRSTTFAYDDPALTLHYRAEGRHEYSVLLFLPTEKPFDLFDPSRKGRVKLYVRRVFITDEADILPGWLRFVRGVIDSEDLPLNISREMLQKNPVLEAVGKGVTSRVLGEIGKLADNDKEKFQKLWDTFGAVIKEGLYEAPERRDDLFKIARFRTTTSGDGWRTLSEVVADLKTNQTAIYYALGESREQVLASPHLEGYAARGLEVLILTDPVDAFWVQTALGFDGKPFKSITQGAADLDAIEKPDNGKEATPPADLAALITALKSALDGKVSDVRASARLDSSPVCLVAADYGLDRLTEKLMSRQEGARAGLKPVLEINPGHDLIKALAEKARAGDSEAVTRAAPLLHGQARILDGEAPENPAAFAASVAEMMAKGL